MIGESGRFGQLDAPMSVAIPEAARCGVSYTVPRRCAAASEQKRADLRVPGWSRPRREAGRADCLGVFEPGNQHRVAAGIGHSSCVFVRRPSMGRYVKSHRGPCGGGQPPQRSIVRSDALTLGESSGRASGIRSDQSRLGNSMNNDVPLVRCWWWTTIPTCVSPHRTEATPHRVRRAHRQLSITRYGFDRNYRSRPSSTRSDATVPASR